MEQQTLAPFGTGLLDFAEIAAKVLGMEGGRKPRDPHFDMLQRLDDLGDALPGNILERARFKITSIFSSTRVLNASTSPAAADITASAHPMMVLVAFSVALMMAPSSSPAAGIRWSRISLTPRAPISIFIAWMYSAISRSSR
jgi:hypothetical protein